ncbi:hypothetical protein EJB05_49914, partial [Eragrostis curvula]
MPSDRRSSEENVRKKAKVHKSSSKDGSDKAVNVVHPQVTSVAAASEPPSKAPVSSSKDSSTRPVSNKPAMSFRPPKVYNLMDVITGPKGGNQSSAKTSSVLKETPSKSLAPAKGSSSSSADAGKFMASEKAKTQDKGAKAVATAPSTAGSKAKIQDKDAEAGVILPVAPKLKAKIQDKTQAGAHKASGEAQIQDKTVGECVVSSCHLSLLNMSELRQMAANLGTLSDRFAVQLPLEPHVQPRGILSLSAGGDLFLHSVFEAMQEEFLPFDVNFDSVEAAEGSSLACDEVPANTFVMSALAAEPFVAAANRIRVPQVEEELMSQGGDALYKSLLSSQVKLSKMMSDRDTLRKDLAALETKVKEKEEALTLSEKCLAELGSEKEVLVKSAEDYEAKVASLDKQVEELDASLAKAVKNNEDHIAKIDATDQEFDGLVKAEELRLADVCGQVRDALVSVGAAPDPLPEDASTQLYQGCLTANIPYVIEACRAFSKNVVQLAVREVLHSLEAGGSDALAKAIDDSFSFATTDSTPPALIRALVKFANNIDESFWNRVLSIGQQPQSEDSSDISLSKFAIPKVSSDIVSEKCAAPESSSDVSLSEFATPKASSDVVSGKRAAPESSSNVSLSEFATPEPSSHNLARSEPPIEIFSSPSEIDLSSESDPFSPSKGVKVPSFFLQEALVYRPDDDVFEGHRRCIKRRSHGRRPRGGSSSSRGTTKKKSSGLRRRDPPVYIEDPYSPFDAASHVERMISSGVVDPVFQRPYSPSSGYDVNEFSI